MTTRNNTRTAIFAAALGLSAIAGAHAQGWGGHGHGRMIFGLLDGVTLTDAQQQQVHADVKAAWQASRPTRQALHAVEDRMRQVMTSSGNVSTASLSPLLSQEETLRAQLDQQRLALALQVRGVLTSSQLAQSAQAQSQLAALHQQEEAIAHPGASGE